MEGVARRGLSRGPSVPEIDGEFVAGVSSFGVSAHGNLLKYNSDSDITGRAPSLAHRVLPPLIPAPRVPLICGPWHPHRRLLDAEEARSLRRRKP